MKKKTTEEIRTLMFKAADSCKPIEKKYTFKFTEDEIIVLEKALLVYISGIPKGAILANKIHDRFYELRKKLDLI